METTPLEFSDLFPVGEQTMFRTKYGESYSQAEAGGYVVPAGSRR